jgi:hypothetical protein
MMYADDGARFDEKLIYYDDIILNNKVMTE